MALNLLTRDQFVQNEVAAIQSVLPGAYQFTVGSIVLALVDAHSSTAMWEQSLIQYVYNRERLATSTGADADSFVGDFGLTRLPAVAATGTVQFSSFVATTARTINVGATVSVQGGSVSFQITADDTNTYYNSAQNAYIIPAGIGTIASPVSLPVQATTAGTIGNVQPNTITVINSPITGIDQVNNANAFVNGVNQQTDPQLRAYFVQWLQSLSRATKGAISFAVESVQGVQEYVLVENTNYDTGLEQLGYFYVVVDDGTGNPSNELVAAVTNAVDAYRGLTIRFEVKKPIVVDAEIVANVIMPSAYNTPTYISEIVNNISSALTLYVDLIPFGETLYYTRVPQIIYNVLNQMFPTIIDQINVNGITVNGSDADISTNFKQSLRTVTAPVINVTFA